LVVFIYILTLYLILCVFAATAPRSSPNTGTTIKKNSSKNNTGTNALETYDPRKYQHLGAGAFCDPSVSTADRHIDYGPYLANFSRDMLVRCGAGSAAVQHALMEEAARAEAVRRAEREREEGEEEMRRRMAREEARRRDLEMAEREIEVRARKRHPSPQRGTSHTGICRGNSFFCFSKVF
jgi:hypothetical protein